MADSALDRFIAECRDGAQCADEPADCVIALAPCMRDLLARTDTFLRPEHYRDDPDHYARNLVYSADDGSLSLFSLVWRPGQWTPVHDHGTWGVVGIVEGVLEERAYMRADPEPHGDADIDLRRGGVIHLTKGAVSSFVPNPDHIHLTGVADGNQRAVSLHLYGRNLNRFHIYDVAARTRQLIDVPHQDS